MKKNFILYTTIIIFFIIIIIFINTNYNYKENFKCINKTVYPNKICKSNYALIINPIDYCNNNDNCNGYISFDFKDKFNNKNTEYYKCYDNWEGEILSKEILYDKLKKNYPDIKFYNFKTHKCNNYCPPGKGIIDNSNTCVECPKNKYNTGDSYLCKDIPKCPTGYDLIDYNNKTGHINCKINSKPGYYYDLNSLSEKACPKGTYDNTYGNTNCIQAEPGYYVDLTGQTTTKPCELGTYTETLGNITCSPAEPGFYVDQKGQTTAKPCAENYTTHAYRSKNANSCVPILLNTQWIYNIPGTYQWTCPENITQISVVAVGGGGGGGNSNGYGASGGGGGGLIWVNNITVIPDTDYTITVGAGGLGNSNGTSNGQNGGDTDFDNLLIAYGGKGGKSTQNSSSNLLGGQGGQKKNNLTNNTDYGGGNGGNGGENENDWSGGGGGAGGYTGNGGNGIGSSVEVNANSGKGGGGGGGATFDWIGNAAPGGGVGIYGQGTNGSGGNSQKFFTKSKGKSGSSGIEAINTDSGNSYYLYGYGGNSIAGKYGGGGGGISNYSYGFSNGGNGALRIIYNPNALFPTTNVSDTDYEKTYINNILQ
tara:strand:- start:890 stop:2671 length:1782 start_codon:yes stop_codon:yes gene_type:complete